MKMSQYIVDIDLKCETGEHMLIHGNNGLVDVISSTDYLTFRKWQDCECISDTDQDENPTLFATLIKRGYLLEDNYDEEDERDKLIQRLTDAESKKSQHCKSVCFVLTYGCNFACPYCYEGSVKNHNCLTKEQVDNIFEIHGNNIPYISFFGGEPLLPTNKDVIQHIISKAPDAQYSMITNGYFLEEYFEIFRNLNISNIQVTFDGMREIHNKTRILKDGRGTFDRILAGVALYAEHGLPITIRMNITTTNEASCVDFEKYICTLPWADNVRIEKQPVFQMDNDTKNQLYNSMLKTDQSSVHKNVMLTRGNSLENFLYRGTPLRPTVKTCNADSKCRYFDPFGNVYSCILAVGNEKKKIGSYNTKLTYSEKSMMTRSIATVPACRKCKYALLCGGGCPNAIPDTMDIQTTPNCGYFQNDLENRIPEIYKIKKQIV